MYTEASPTEIPNVNYVNQPLREMDKETVAVENKGNKTDKFIVNQRPKSTEVSDAINEDTVTSESWIAPPPPNAGQSESLWEFVNKPVDREQFRPSQQYEVDDYGRVSYVW